MADDTLKCPQCSTPYLIVSYNPPALRFLDRLTYLTSRVARVGAIISVSSVVIVAGTTVFAMLTVYAAYAVEQFAGRDVFMLLYGDDITKWSIWAWMELPLIPVAVSLPSRTYFSHTVDDFAQLLASNSTSSLNSFFLSAWVSLAFPSSHVRQHSGSTWSWPPSPLFTFTIWPFLRLMSQVIRNRLRKWVVENATAPAIATTPTRLRPAADEGPFVLNIIQHGPEDDAPPQQRRQQAPANPDGERPVVARPAERVITGGMIGRLIIGSLSRPFIANVMGNALLSLSKCSSWLRHLLGVHKRRPFIARLPNGAPWSIGLHSAKTWTWDELDPVWCVCPVHSSERANSLRLLHFPGGEIPSASDYFKSARVLWIFGTSGCLNERRSRGEYLTETLKVLISRISTCYQTGTDLM